MSLTSSDATKLHVTVLSLVLLSLSESNRSTFCATMPAPGPLESEPGQSCYAMHASTKDCSGAIFAARHSTVCHSDGSVA